MTYLKRYLADSDEVLSVRITCNTCTAAFHLPISKTDKIIPLCPFCRTKFFANTDIKQQAVIDLVNAITVLKAEDEQPACHIQIELEYPPS